MQAIQLDKSSNGLKINIDVLNKTLLHDKCKNRPVCVVSIAGAFREGKSFMLNFFLRYLYHLEKKQQQQQDQQNDENNEWIGNQDDKLDGFSWRSGEEPETTGILIWHEPIVIKNKDGDEVAVILMDTQGSFDSRQTINQVATTFALSTLVSSIQIYNLMRTINENNLQFLDSFSAFGRLVLDKSAEKPFQKLWFLVRDWRSPKDHPYGLEGGEKFLEKKLALDDDHESTDSKTRTRIINCFHQMNCFLMPDPGYKAIYDNEEGEPFTGQIKDISPKFIEYLKEFVPNVLAPENLVVKRIGGKTLNGQDLLEYFRSYAQTFQGEEIPEATTWYEAATEAGNSNALREARDYYIDSMREVCGPSQPFINPDILDQKHIQLSAEAISLFARTKKLEDLKSYADQLDQCILKEYEAFKESNKSKNMFNLWGSPLIILCCWFIALFIGKIFEFIGITVLSTIFHAQATIALIVLILYLSTKYSGNLPEVVTAIDQATEFLSDQAMRFVFGLVMNHAQLTNN